MMLDTESPITDVVTTDPHVVEGSIEPPYAVFDPPDGGGSGGDMPPERPRPNRRRFGGGGTGAVRADDEGSGSFDLRNTWQVAAGAILIPLGVIIILIAWYGSAHARVVQQQIPYLVSGSFVGLGCMVVGGFFFFGHWIYRLWDQADLQHEETLRALEAIAAALAGSAPRVAMGGTAAGVVPTMAPGPGPGGLGSYYATATGTVYHRADCAVIAHHPNDLRVLGADGLSGLLPCQICAPE
jgi:hypothetical protein